MLYGYGLLAVFELCLLVYCTLNVITTPDTAVRNLPKLLWLVLVILFPVVGGVAWLVAGRPQRSGTSGVPYKGNRGGLPPSAGPTRRTASSPDDDEDFLRGLRQRADEQRRAAEEQRRREQEGGAA